MRYFTFFVVVLKGNYTQSDKHYQIFEIVILMISRIPNLILLNVSGHKVILWETHVGHQR